MSAPVILQVVPDVHETDVVLGQALVITLDHFDQVIDTTTIDDQTFGLSYPAPTQILTSEQLIAGVALSSTVPVTGTWTFVTNSSDQTVATFQPDNGFQPNTIYTAQLLGADADLSTENVMNPVGESMAVSYGWSFTTGQLNLATPPPTSPLADDCPAIPLDQIRIMPRRALGQDLTQAIDIIFPGAIDPTSVDLTQIYMSIEAILGDPSVVIPAGLEYAAAIAGNIITITVSGWPAGS